MTQYKIHGYDQLFGDKYTSDETYNSKAEAQSKCRSMEWVEETRAVPVRIAMIKQPTNR